MNSGEEGDEVETAEQVKLLGKKLSGTTVKCGASLVFASIGAGIGATLFRPSAGQWIGKHSVCEMLSVWTLLVMCRNS